MIIYPAIDLKRGQCVRLLRGEMTSATVYNDDPAAQAGAFETFGFGWIHVVDLDGAVGGASANAPAVASILRRVRVPVQLGGGIRDRAAIERWLEAGVSRVILGTAAVRNPDLVREAAKAHPSRIAVGIDARAGQVAVDGWTSESGVPATDLARRFEDAGVCALIYTDIARDGTGEGVNVEETSRIAASISIPVIASGGIGSIDDLRTLMRDGDANISGVICGRSLYDGRLDPAEAISLAKAGRQAC